jgi:NAD(P)-dependent dehydrogenase (short-subunit alcohol dehydrogenase family)
MREFEFEGASAVVTGGGSGIGRSMAIECARRGSHIDGDSAAAVAGEIIARPVLPYRLRRT